MDYKVGDEVELDFTLKDGNIVPDCVWAVVAKDELRSIKNKRWDLVSCLFIFHSSFPSVYVVGCS